MKLVFAFLLIPHMGVETKAWDISLFIGLISTLQPVSCVSMAKSCILPVLSLSVLWYLEDDSTACLRGMLERQTQWCIQQQWEEKQISIWATEHRHRNYLKAEEGFSFWNESEQEHVWTPFKCLLAAPLPPPPACTQSIHPYISLSERMSLMFTHAIHLHFQLSFG